MRLIIDPLGDGHHDLFLKIDVMPSQLKIADSYYLFDFLEISQEEIKTIKQQQMAPIAYGALQLIEYWESRMLSMSKGQIVFLLFDLSDQYVGGFRVTKMKYGYQFEEVFTKETAGYAVNKSTLDSVVSLTSLQTSKHSSSGWLISEERWREGLDWSKKQLVNQ